MKKKSSSSHGIVYSTDPTFRPVEEEAIVETLPPAEQPLRILLDKKQRAGKVVTLIIGFIGNDSDLQSLGKQLRNHCGTGGSAKDGEVIVQATNVKRSISGYSNERISFCHEFKFLFGIHAQMGGYFFSFSSFHQNFKMDGTIVELLV